MSSGKNTVRISSIEQLDSECDGELVVYTLEKMSSNYNGFTLNSLVIDTMNLFHNDDDKELFLTKVRLQGYEYDAYYDEFVYEIVNVSCYCVNSEFPRLKRSDLSDAVVAAVYDLSLLKIGDYEIKD